MTEPAANLSAVDLPRSAFARFAGGSAGLAALFLVALLARLTYTVAMGGRELQTRITGAQNDPAAYDWEAQNLLEHGNIGFRGQPSARRAPAYPVFLAGVYAVLGHSYFAARLVQMVMDASISLLIAGMLRRLGRSVAGWLSGLLYALYPPFIFNAAEIMTEGLVLFFTALTVYLLVRAGDDLRRWRFVLLGGLSAGALYLTRENYILLIPLLAIVLLSATAAAWRVRCACVGLLALGFMIFYGPYLVRNCLVFRAVLVTGTSGSENFLRGIASGLYGPKLGSSGQPWNWYQYIRDQGLLPYWEYYDPANAGKPFMDEVAADRRARELALQLIRENPGFFVTYGLRKVEFLLLNRDLTSTPHRADLLRTGVSAAYYVSLVLGLTGLVIALRRRWHMFAGSLIAVGAVCLPVIFLADPFKRYRFVSLDFACICASGVALVALWEAGRRRRTQRRPAAAVA